MLQLDFVVLGATEVDLDFNANVETDPLRRLAFARHRRLAGDGFLLK